MARLARGLEAVQRAQMSRRTRKYATPPSPLPLRRRRMLLITKDEAKNQTRYPTMFMILNGLLPNLILALYYFQNDRLWKSRTIRWSTRRTHDVIGRKGDRLETIKLPLMFSILYPDEKTGNFANFAWNPTISMTGNDLLARQDSAAVTYVVEKKQRSVLAFRNRAFRTHDVYGGKCFRLKRRLFDSRYTLRFCSLGVASSLVAV
jgi:hypothetical protein